MLMYQLGISALGVKVAYAMVKLSGSLPRIWPLALNLNRTDNSKIQISKGYLTYMKHRYLTKCTHK